MITRISKIALMSVTGMGVVLLGGCDLGPKQSQQLGYRGSGMDQVVDVAHLKEGALQVAAIPAAPYPLPADGGVPASQTYKNVKVLGGLGTERFNHLMAEISQWIAPPEQGCAYCHNPENMASDEKYTKIVARRMIQMTQTINSKWSSHVQNVGVTCYTCHRGNAVPAYKWAMAPDAPNPGAIRGNKFGQNTPDPAVGYASLPYDPFTQYLMNSNNQIRVNGTTALPTPEHKVSVKTAEKTYGLMMHMSTALGVNCEYCHNSQAFADWSISRPQRVTAYYGIRMVRNINEDYIGSLTSVFPANRKGPNGDPYKVNCLTCHQGLSKPLNGTSMLSQAPVLWGPVSSAPAPAMPLPTATPLPTPTTAPVAAVAPVAKAPRQVAMAGPR